MNALPIHEDEIYEDDDSANITMTLAEYYTLVKMPGGVCLENWLKVRGLGLDHAPTATVES